MSQKKPKTYEDVRRIFVRLLCDLMTSIPNYYKTETMSEEEISKALDRFQGEMDYLDETEMIFNVEKEFHISIDNNKVDTIERAIVFVCMAKNIPVPEKAKSTKAYLLSSGIKAYKPITLKKSNETIAFYQGDKVLSLKDPQVSPYVQMLQKALARQK